MIEAHIDNLGEANGIAPAHQGAGDELKVLRLRTLVRLRWLAVVGQTAAVIAVKAPERRGIRLICSM